MSSREFPKKLAERSGSRTHQRRPTPLDGFENRAPHRGAIPIRNFDRTELYSYAVSFVRTSFRFGIASSKTNRKTMCPYSAKPKNGRSAEYANPKGCNSNKMIPKFPNRVSGIAGLFSDQRPATFKIVKVSIVMLINSIRSATALALVVICGTPAAAEFRYDNNSGGYSLFYGQLNPAYQGVDDGVASYDNLVDNANSNSRVGYWFRQPTDAGLFSFNFETALGFRQSSSVSQTFVPDAWDLKRTSIRKIDISLKTDTAGTFSIGQGSVAHDGAAEVDLSETTVATYSWIAGSAGSYVFRTSGGALSTNSIGAAMPNYDGGRRGRIRYDTPSFSGFTAAASYGEEILNQSSDLKVGSIALRYTGESGPVKMQGAIAYAHVEPAPGTNYDEVIGSFSLLHDSGFNATIAGGNRENGGQYGYIKLGYIGQWLPYGNTALSIDYYSGNDTALSTGSQSSSYGLAVVQKFHDVGVDVYLSVRSYELSEPGISYQDISSVLIGARWKF